MQFFPLRLIHGETTLSLPAETLQLMVAALWNAGTIVLIRAFLIVMGTPTSETSWGPERFEVFTAVKIQAKVCWVVMPCNVMAGYQHFGGSCYLHLHPEDRGSMVL